MRLQGSVCCCLGCCGPTVRLQRAAASAAVCCWLSQAAAALALALVLHDEALERLVAWGRAAAAVVHAAAASAAAGGASRQQAASRSVCSTSEQHNLPSRLTPGKAPAWCKALPDCTHVIHTEPRRPLQQFRTHRMLLASLAAACPNPTPSHAAVLSSMHSPRRLMANCRWLLSAHSRTPSWPAWWLAARKRSSSSKALYSVAGSATTRRVSLSHSTSCSCTFWGRKQRWPRQQQQCRAAEVCQ